LTLVGLVLLVGVVVVAPKAVRSWGGDPSVGQARRPPPTPKEVFHAQRRQGKSQPLRLDKAAPRRGEYDHVSKSQLEGIVETLLDDASTRAVVIDLSDTDFVNLPVVDALARATECASARQKHFIVVLPQAAGPVVRRLFDLIEADTLLRVVPSMQDALEATSKDASG
jgi:anti-anti-sigma regulatory factor